MRRQNLGRDSPRPRWWKIHPSARDNIVTALHAQPLLRLTEAEGRLVIKGRFGVHSDGRTLDSFPVRIHFPGNYPNGLPIVEVLGDRVPTTPDRHINSDRSACLYVPEEWLAHRPDDDFSTFLSVPVRNFFLGQLYYEKHKRFPPTGERQHYGAGLIDAYADILGVSANINEIHYWLRILASDRSKGHWDCTCGSGKIVRQCCRQLVFDKQQDTPVWLAKRMKREILKELEHRRQKRTRRRVDDQKRDVREAA
ncbi:hypothetical protein [Henriciella mobilis]|uniref:hypothetical protein n=1 Tax=Henriciella mobilis TaxID=2305467 RepID=UPI00131501D0|nr:hypothetical protein [Henriciella mobilis]